MVDDTDPNEPRYSLGTETGRALELARLLASPRFAALATALEKGRHIGPEDLEFYPFLRRNFLGIVEFYRTWRSEILDGGGYYYLSGDPDHFGTAQLTAEDMVIGQALAASFLDSNRMARGGTVELDDFLDDLERHIGSTQRFLQILSPRGVKRPRARSEVEHREAARESALKTLRRLDNLGFVDLTDTPDASVALYPRQASLRFVEPARRAAGREAELLEVIKRMFLSGELAACDGEINIGSGIDAEQNNADHGKRETDGHE